MYLRAQNNLHALSKFVGESANKFTTRGFRPKMEGFLSFVFTTWQENTVSFVVAMNSIYSYFVTA